MLVWKNFPNKRKEYTIVSEQWSKIVFHQPIWRAKARFFITRLLTYFSLLLLPVWIPKLLTLHPLFHFLLIISYLLFLFSQWYLLAKEIDHRFKIHVKTNSSLERTLYRVLAGQAFMILYFNLVSFAPISLLNHFYWGTWVALDLYYSWPTRGKIIQESVSSDFNEYKFLDGFEKTTFFLIILTVLISIPAIPFFDSIEVLRLYLDPQGYIHNIFWNYLQIISFPFHKFPGLLHLSYVLYFYLVSAVILLISFYSLVRYFVGRRLSILGTYALVSCWAFSTVMQASFLELIFSTAALSWLWAMFWTLRAGNYRVGLILGMINVWISLLHPGYYFLYWLQIFYLFYLSQSTLTLWYRQQVFRYTILGGIISFLIFLTHQDHNLLSWQLGQWFNYYFPAAITHLEKSFFALGPIALIVLFIIKPKSPNQYWKALVAQKKIYDLLMLFLCLLILGLLIFPPIFGIYLVLIFAVLLCIIPLEHLFLLIQHVKSQRNIIFLSYLIICLLDSHMEGRVKILIGQFIRPF